MLFPSGTKSDTFPGMLEPEHRAKYVVYQTITTEKTWSLR